MLSGLGAVTFLLARRSVCRARSASYPMFVGVASPFGVHAATHRNYCMNADIAKAEADYEYSDRVHAICLVECHYFVNDCFLTADDQLLVDMPKIAHIPGVIVQGWVVARHPSTPPPPPPASRCPTRVVIWLCRKVPPGHCV